MEALFHEVFDGMKRLAPGSDASTRHAAELVGPLGVGATILDIGCGTGASTFVLAELYPQANLVAIDSWRPYIDRLNAEARERELEGRVRGDAMSMFEMDFADASFDLVWAEGSAYLAGFSRALGEWRRLVKPGGFLAVSEIGWIVDVPSAESRAFWEAGYAEMASRARKEAQVRELGYELAGSFVLPKEDWTVSYYRPLEGNLAQLTRRHPESEAARKVVSALRAEMDLHERRGDEYGYVFYVMRKVDEGVGEDPRRGV